MMRRRGSVGEVATWIPNVLQYNAADDAAFCLLSADSMHIRSLQDQACAFDVPPWLQTYRHEHDVEGHEGESWALLANHVNGLDSQKASPVADVSMERSLRLRLDLVTGRARKVAVHSGRVGTWAGQQRSNESAALSKGMKKGKEGEKCAIQFDGSTALLVDGVLADACRGAGRVT